jgi:ketosteroid isomerase-like protein
MTQNLQEHLTALEQERCRCLMQDDVAGLRKLLCEDLVHVHTRGNVHDLDQYLDFVQTVAQVLEISRGPLIVRAIGDNAAVMLGHQTNRSRGRATGETKVIRAQVAQVWVRVADGTWRISVFQGTPLPAEQ